MGKLPRPYHGRAARSKSILSLQARTTRPGQLPQNQGTSHTPFFSFDAPDAPSRIGGELTLVVDRRDF